MRTIPQGQICKQLTPASLQRASLCLSRRPRHIGKIRFKDLKTFPHLTIRLQMQLSSMGGFCESHYQRGVFSKLYLPRQAPKGTPEHQCQVIFYYDPLRLRQSNLDQKNCQVMKNPKPTQTY